MKIVLDEQEACEAFSFWTNEKMRNYGEPHRVVTHVVADNLHKNFTLTLAPEGETTDERPENTPTD